MLALLLMSAALCGCSIRKEQTEDQAENRAEEQKKAAQAYKAVEEPERTEGNNACLWNIKGINYDAGVEYGSAASINNKWIDEATAEREMQIIKNDLHCNAVRASGTGVDRMRVTAEYALRQGMDVWISPHYIDLSQKTVIERTVECAACQKSCKSNIRTTKSFL